MLRVIELPHQFLLKFLTFFNLKVAPFRNLLSVLSAANLSQDVLLELEHGLLYHQVKRLHDLRVHLVPQVWVLVA